MQPDSDAHLVIVKARLLDTQDALGEIRHQMDVLCETAGVADSVGLLKWIGAHRELTKPEHQSDA